MSNWPAQLRLRHSPQFTSKFHHIMVGVAIMIWGCEMFIVPQKGEAKGDRQNNNLEVTKQLPTSDQKCDKGYQKVTKRNVSHLPLFCLPPLAARCAFRLVISLAL